MRLEYGTIGMTSEGKPVKRLFFNGKIDRDDPHDDPFFDYHFKYSDYDKKSLLRFDSQYDNFDSLLERVVNKCQETGVGISLKAQYYIDYRFRAKAEKEAKARAEFEAMEARRLEQRQMMNPEYRIAHTPCPGDCSQCYFCDTGYGTSTKYCRYLNDRYKKQGYEGEAPCDWHGKPMLAYIVTYESMIGRGRPEECPYLKKERAV